MTALSKRPSISCSDLYDQHQLQEPIQNHTAADDDTATAPPGLTHQQPLGSQGKGLRAWSEPRKSPRRCRSASHWPQAASPPSSRGWNTCIQRWNSNADQILVVNHHTKMGVSAWAAHRWDRKNIIFETVEGQNIAAHSVRRCHGIVAD